MAHCAIWTPPFLTQKICSETIIKFVCLGWTSRLRLSLTLSSDQDCSQLERLEASCLSHRKRELPLYRLPARNGGMRPGRFSCQPSRSHPYAFQFWLKRPCCCR